MLWEELISFLSECYLVATLVQYFAMYFNALQRQLQPPWFAHAQLMVKDIHAALKPCFPCCNISSTKQQFD